MDRKNLTSPMMRQWVRMKEEIGNDVILFCRVGDFYELFFEDAEVGARELDITLTSRKIRDTAHPLAGVPVRSVDLYVGKLVNKGYKVAIADQLEDPKAVKGVVERGITRIVTKGTLTEDSLLTENNNYIASILRDRKTYGLALADLSCGEFYARNFTTTEEIKEMRFILDTMQPVEVIFPESERNSLIELWGKEIEHETVSPLPEFWFDPQEAEEVLEEHFGVKSMKGFGLSDQSLGVCAAGALLRYLQDTQKRKVSNITKIQILESKNSMLLDRGVIRSLELFNNTVDNSEEGSLFKLLNQTVTPMGTRELKKWIGTPLTSVDTINRRLDTVDRFISSELAANHIRGEMEHISDIERLGTRISLGVSKPSEIIRLLNSLMVIPSIRASLEQIQNEATIPIPFLEKIKDCQDIVDFIQKMILSEPAVSVADGDVIAPGVNERLDELRELLKEGERWIERFIEREKQRTGITSLKVKQNRHLGYFIEVTKSNTSKVPDTYITKQSMVNVVRYISDELKDWEYNILNAEIEIKQIEQSLYENFLKDLSKHVDRLQDVSKGIAELDVLLAFTFISISNEYTRPTINDGFRLEFSGIRHPVIESFLGEYVPNDVLLDKEEQRLLIITGPNFSGKSSLLRSVALNVIMAQIGCFIPCSAATIGIVDRIFTRIGASDNLIAGQSTFMVEMLDAANLVNNSTTRSLIIADELGRGTSTYDGLAIAWAIAEHLHNSEAKPLTMIATHFHQLAELEGFLESAKNFHFKIGFDGEKPLFDHRIFPGSSDKSFGVEVAKLAGLPTEIILRARFILSLLESKSSSINEEEKISKKVSGSDEVERVFGTIDDWFSDDFDPEETKNKLSQMKPMKKMVDPKPVFTPEETEVLSTLRNLTVNAITPIKAIEILEYLTSLLNSES